MLPPVKYRCCIQRHLKPVLAAKFGIYHLLFTIPVSRFAVDHSPFTFHISPFTTMNDQLTPLQSIELIQSMISKTKSSLRQNSFYFLFWGWLAFSALLVQFILKTILDYPRHYLVWLVTIPAVFITIRYGKKHGGRGARTYIGDSMGHLWMGIGISFFVLSFIISAGPSGWLYAYPFFILFYGMGTFISGRLLQFKPMIIGGIFNWVLAAICPLLPYDYQILLAALALLTSYIIPGHLLNREK